MLLLLLLPLAMGDPTYGAPPTHHPPAPPTPRLPITNYNAIMNTNFASPKTYANNYVQRPTSAFGGRSVYRKRRSLKKVASKTQSAINLGWRRAKSYASTLARKLKLKTRGRRQVYGNAAAMALAARAYQLEKETRARMQGCKDAGMQGCKDERMQPKPVPGLITLMKTLGTSHY